MHAISDEALNAIISEAWKKVPSTYWRHRNGHLYAVVNIALREEDHTPLVIYQGVGCGLKAEGTPWARPLPEFLDGRFTQEGPKS